MQAFSILVATCCVYGHNTKEHFVYTAWLAIFQMILCRPNSAAFVLKKIQAEYSYNVCVWLKIITAKWQQLILRYVNSEWYPNIVNYERPILIEVVTVGLIAICEQLDYKIFYYVPLLQFALCIEYSLWGLCLFLSPAVICAIYCILCLLTAWLKVVYLIFSPCDKILH